MTNEAQGHTVDPKVGLQILKGVKDKIYEAFEGQGDSPASAVMTAIVGYENALRAIEGSPPRRELPPREVVGAAIAKCATEDAGELTGLKHKVVKWPQHEEALTDAVMAALREWAGGEGSGGPWMIRADLPIEDWAKEVGFGEFVNDVKGHCRAYGHADGDDESFARMVLISLRDKWPNRDASKPGFRVTREAVQTAVCSGIVCPEGSMDVSYDVEEAIKALSKVIRAHGGEVVE